MNRPCIICHKDKTISARRWLIGFILAGLLTMLLPVIYYIPDYDDLSEREIQVQKIYSILTRSGVQSRYLMTRDGEKLQIRGESVHSELVECLKPESVVTIKYYHGLHYFRETDFIQEMTLDGKILVSYNGETQLQRQIICCVLGCVLIGIGLLIYYGKTGAIRSALRRGAKMQRKRIHGKQPELTATNPLFQTIIEEYQTMGLEPFLDHIRLPGWKLEECTDHNGIITIIFTRKDAEIIIDLSDEEVVLHFDEESDDVILVQPLTSDVFSDINALSHFIHTKCTEYYAEKRSEYL